ncbi:gfo/Idh/MocA family oxidoreductase [Microbacterium sp. AISO3]|jgi:predicted dehydrogenase|uniref:Dehydrogenase n=2 Tax=Microbacterium TaxID=33882 RepID=A0ABU1HY34_9MICO|nr:MULTISPECIES: Gfo/Idh/MocA family oxidoreductase [Microbacterium]MDR6166320.1 putative dehydrogenase [Microbacterium paludicola]OAZ39685.1 oxidoreductase [Microbacterium arborescens]OWP22843.1 gfo/Idh/MocA family oxidoreductase [Microbacterium sp. AISO3]GAD33032.1 putative dehydrogenase [Microbacterium sp. TS-1]
MFRIGIIGTGGIASAHIGGYLAFPEDCEIVALADVSPGKAAQKAEEFGIAGAVGYDDPLRMIAEAELDLVSIATPPSTHAALSIAALDAGVNVLVEKPMAPSLEECDAMLAAQERSGKVLSVVAQNRFRDDLATLKAVVDSGLLGSISSVRVDSAWWRGLPYYDLWWRGTWEKEGGGCTLNHAIHHIDLLLWLLGRPTEITAMLANAQHDNSEVEDLSVAVLRYERGLAQLTSSVVHHGEEQQIVIQGAKARVSQPWRVIAERADGGGFPAKGGDADLVAAIEGVVAAREPLAHAGHTGQIADVLSAIRDGREPIAGGRDGRNAIEVVAAIYKAGIERTFVDLPLAADDPYYRSGHLVERAPHFYEKQTSLVEAAS